MPTAETNGRPAPTMRKAIKNLAIKFFLRFKYTYSFLLENINNFILGKDKRTRGGRGEEEEGGGEVGNVRFNAQFKVRAILGDREKRIKRR